MLGEEYSDVVETRDLFWVQLLLLERQVPALIYPDAPLRVYMLLGEVKMVITRIEDSMAYMRRWGAEQGWKMDFNSIEEQLGDNRSSKHPCCLLAPYIVEIPVSGTLPPDDEDDSEEDW